MPDDKPGGPPLDYNPIGWGSLNVFRLRPTWFGVRLEELWQRRDGQREWRKCLEPVAWSGTGGPRG
jgi:hypothetical protein